MSTPAKSHSPVNWDRRIYLASSATLADLLREQDDRFGATLMVGHNPGLDDLVADLTDPAELAASPFEGFKTKQQV